MCWRRPGCGWLGTEPTEVSHLVRYACAAIAFNTTWQAMQADGWADDRLARFSASGIGGFLQGLPEVEAFARAAHVAAASLSAKHRSSELDGSRASSVPVIAWNAFIEHWRCVRYRHCGYTKMREPLALPSIGSFSFGMQSRPERGWKCANFPESRTRPLPIQASLADSGADQHEAD